MSVLINRIKGRSNENTSHLGAEFRAEYIVEVILFAQKKNHRVIIIVVISLHMLISVYMANRSTWISCVLIMWRHEYNFTPRI